MHLVTDITSDILVVGHIIQFAQVYFRKHIDWPCEVVYEFLKKTQTTNYKNTRSTFCTAKCWSSTEYCVFDTNIWIFVLLYSIHSSQPFLLYSIYQQHWVLTKILSNTDLYCSHSLNIVYLPSCRNLSG